MSPFRLQPEAPLDEVVRRLTNLFYLVVFLGAAILPAIKQARSKRRKEQRWWDALGRSASAPQRPPVPPRDQVEIPLEEKVRRLFEGRVAAESTPPPPPPPAPPSTASLSTYRAQPRTKDGSMRIAASIGATPGERRRRQDRAAAELRGLLSRPASLRAAVVAAEILGPPRGLSDPPSAGWRL